MKREDLFEAIGGVAEERLELSERSYKRHAVWIRYGGIAAGICLVILAAIAIPQVIRNNIMYSDSLLSTDSKKENSYDMEETAGETYYEEEAENSDMLGNDAGDMGQDDGTELESVQDMEDGSAHTERTDRVYSFTLDMVAYDANSIGGTVIYVPMSYEERQTLSLPDDVQITEEDLGDYMGTVQNCGDETWNGCMVYYSAKYPTNHMICIVDLGGSYIYAVNQEGI